MWGKMSQGSVSGICKPMKGKEPTPVDFASLFPKCRKYSRDTKEKEPVILSKKNL